MQRTGQHVLCRISAILLSITCVNSNPSFSTVKLSLNCFWSLRNDTSKKNKLLKQRLVNSQNNFPGRRHWFPNFNFKSKTLAGDSNRPALNAFLLTSPIPLTFLQCPPPETERELHFSETRWYFCNQSELHSLRDLNRCICVTYLCKATSVFFAIPY